MAFFNGLQLWDRDCIPEILILIMASLSIWRFELEIERRLCCTECTRKPANISQISFEPILNSLLVLDGYGLTF
jgi:hypothetical protein